MVKVSIVLPTYNGEKYIKESINSILKQTFKEWELIIVNDCSTDSTREIIERYIQQDKRIRVIDNQTNSKLPASLNIGFKDAKGEFLTWTSDDNIYLDDAIERMYDFLVLHHEFDMVCASMNVLSEEGISKNRGMYHEQHMYYNNCVGACFLYRRIILEKVGEYRKDMFCVEDYDYWLRILRTKSKIGYMAEVLYLYREHAESLTSRKTKYIAEQLTKLRIENLEWILSNLQGAPDLICRMYYETVENGSVTENVRKLFCRFLPELSIEKELPDCDKLSVLFGAGVYGQRALDIFGDSVSYFADNNVKLIGKCKQGIQICSTKRMIEEQDLYNIIVCANKFNTYDMLHFLYENGIKECVVLLRLLEGE